MTMLDRMRRHKAWLKWSLAIVVLAFIVLYFPQFMRQAPTGAAAPTDTLATVEGRKISAGTFQRLYNIQVAQFRAAYGEVNEQMLQQLGLAPQLVEQLINQEAVLAEAHRLGVTVTDSELRARLIRWPTFQENGHFIGETRYRQLLDMQRPPTRPAEFEAELRNALTAEKLEAAVTGWLRVSDADVAQEYGRRHEKVKLELATFTADQFRAGITPTEAEVAARFKAQPETYRVPEKRRVRYIAINASDLAPRMTVTPQEIEARYREDAQSFSTPEQVQASHILFKTEGKDEAAVRKTAQGVLAKAKAGADFAALARQFSEDEGSKAGGGDLKYFGRGSMVKEFEDAAWVLKPGQISDLVQSQFGFHIIKLTGRHEAVTRTLDDVRLQIEQQRRTEKAQAEATRIADAVAASVDDPTDLDRVAAEHKLTVGDSGLFTRQEPLGGLGFAPAVAAEAFRLATGKVSGRLTSNDGYAIIALTEVKPSALPTLDEVRTRVRDDVVRAKALDVATSKAAAFARTGGSNFAAAVKAAGGKVSTTELITRGSALPEVGVNEEIDNAVFALKPGETSRPISTDNAIVVARVTAREDVDPAALAAERDTLRTQLTQQRRGEFFAAYMNKAKSRMRILRNEDVVAQLLGS